MVLLKFFLRAGFLSFGNNRGSDQTGPLLRSSYLALLWIFLLDLGGEMLRFNAFWEDVLV